MIKKIAFLVLVSFACTNGFAQKSGSQDNFYINLFISADKTIYVEKEKTGFQNIQKSISEIIRNKPFVLDQQIIYRIFGDEDLDLGYIIDVNNQLLDAYRDDVRTERYLLKTVDLNIDGKNWLQSIDMKKLKKIN